MIEEWSSYRVADFIPFTAEVYFRLIERTGEAFWPLHLLTVLVGLASVVVVWSGRNRLALAMLAPVWVWVGISFLMQRYGQLNWAGEYFGWAFVVQGLLLGGLAATGWGTTRFGQGRTFTQWAGMSCAVFGLLGYPLIAPLAGQSWYQAETFGIHPEPTAIFTLGIILASQRGFSSWLTALIPLLWCLIAALTLQVLDAAWWLVPLSVAALVMGLMLVRSISDIGFSRTDRTDIQ